MTALPEKLQRARDISWRAMGDQSVLVNWRNGFYYTTNHVGSFIWNLCDGTHPLKTMIEQVSGTFGIDEEKAKGEVSQFLKELRHEGFIQ